VNFLEQFKAARRVSTPLIAVRTPDPAATIAAISQQTNGDPLLQWDIARGLIGLNEEGQKAASTLCGNDPEAMQNPIMMLKACVALPGGPEKNISHGAILFFLNPQFFLKDPQVVQAIWNLRDVFKLNGRALVMLAPEVTFPPELSQDVILFDEPYPDAEKLTAIVNDAFESIGANPPKGEKSKKIIAALRGLAAFPAEQVAFMSLTREKGMDVAQCWERKYSVVEETPSLGIWRKKETFSDVEGVANGKNFIRGIFEGEEPPDLIVFMDEIEKMFSQGDLSGSSQQQHGAILKWMQNNNVLGVMFVGHPGAAKTALAHASAGEFNVPLVEFDVDAAQGSLVGQTGEQTRQALKVIDAMGRPLVIATSNSIASLSPELRRRFQLSTFFFDLPNKKERDAIWGLYLKKYKLADIRGSVSMPEDEGWTGAEIRTCCDLAWRLRKTLKEAATYIVPVSRSASDRVASLRAQAAGKWINASEPGVYQQPAVAIANTGRGVSR
jgi:hypothetical protein